MTQTDTNELNQNNTSLFDLVVDRQGWSDDYLKDVNTDIDHSLYDNYRMSDALQIIYKNQENIVVLPDFDMDGISSGIMLHAGLTELNFKSHIIIPDYNRGHDLDPRYINDIIEKIPDVKAIITTDSGVNSLDIAKYAKTLGIKFLVTDHHVQEVKNPYADVIVNPNSLIDKYPFKGICGAMVALEVLRDYTMTYQPIKYYDIDMLRVFAGIGTVADVMPLLYNNRKIVKDSISFMKLLYVEPVEVLDANDNDINVEPPMPSTLLQLIEMNPHSETYINAFKGLQQIIYTFAKNKKLRSIDDISESFYGFYLAPSFNSARRVEADINPAFMLFTTNDSHDRAQFAQYIFKTNETRKNLVKQYVDEMVRINELVYLSKAPAGVLGLLATKIANETNLPAIVLNHLSDDQFSGSGRSPQWYQLRSKVSELNAFAQGHEYACGVGFSSKQQLDEISKLLINDITHQYNTLKNDNYFEDNDILLSYETNSDWSLADDDALLDTIRSLDTLRPFGHSFTEPAFNIQINLKECSVSLLGKERNHIKITTKTGIVLLWWNAEDKWLGLNEAKNSLDPNENIKTFKTHLSTNDFMGNLSINAIVDKEI